MENVIILGTGPAGLTASLYLARAKLSPLVIEGPEPGGQLSLTTEVENFPGFAEGILGPELIDNMRKQSKRFGATFKTGWVTKVDISTEKSTLFIENIGEIETKALIIATGASTKFVNIPGEQENLGRGVSTCATCDGIFYTDQKVVVIGGGDSAMEEAIQLSKFASEVTIIHRRTDLRASKIMQDRTEKNPKIKWKLNYCPLEVLNDETEVKGIKIRNNETQEVELLETDGVFVAIGHKPNTDLFKDIIDRDSTGYIKVIKGSTKTNVPGVFACGDVQDAVYRQAITAAGTGCMAALDCERYLEEVN